MPADFQAIGPGRFEMAVRMPWGEDVPAEVLVTTARGWKDRPESRDGSWTAFRVGPAMVAVRLLGERPAAWGLPRSMVPAEWN